MNPQSSASLALVLAGCWAGAPAPAANWSASDTVAVAEYRMIPARTAADSALVTRVRGRRDAIDAYVLRDARALIRIARLPSGLLAPVAATAEWPDSTEIAFGLLRDSVGRVAYAYESPQSESGDWYLVTRHYFDSTGSTVLVERRASFFSGCWDQQGDSVIAIREALTSYYGPHLRLARRDFVRTALDTAIPAPAEGCNRAFQEPFPVYASWTALSKATQLGPFVQAR